MIFRDSESSIQITRMELVPEITAAFPVACYDFSLADRSDPWHWHVAFEINLVTEGRAQFQLGGKSYVLQQGQGCFINRAALHAVLPNGKHSGRIQAIDFLPDLVAGAANSVFYKKYIQPLQEARFFQGLSLTNDVPWQNELLSFAAQLVAVSRIEAHDYEITVRELATRILALINAHYEEYKTETVAGLPEKTAHIKPMLLYIWENYSSPLALTEIAAAGMVSKNECLRSFSSIMGLSPIQYVKTYRLQKAAEYLQTTSLSVYEIALQCGFQDGGYFARAFKEHYHMLPSAYRKSR